MYSLAKAFKNLMLFKDVALPVLAVLLLPALCMLIHSLIIPDDPLPKFIIVFAALVSLGSGTAYFLMRKQQSGLIIKYSVAALFAVSTFYTIFLALLMI